jgi:outer membrane protein W
MNKTLALLLMVAALAAEAQAGEVQVSLGASAGTSTWSGDPVGHYVTRVGYRFRDLAAFDFGYRFGYASVDERFIHELSLGGTLYGRLGAFRPYLRGAGVHQHEEPIVSVEADPAGALFATGDGIRHRYGFTGQLGVDLPIAVTNVRSQWVIGAHVASSWFPDERGPSTYLMGGLSLGVNYDL